MTASHRFVVIYFVPVLFSLLYVLSDPEEHALNNQLSTCRVSHMPHVVSNSVSADLEMLLCAEHLPGMHEALCPGNRGSQSI